MNKNTVKIILSPLFAPIATFLLLTIFGFIAIAEISAGNFLFFEDGHFCANITYICYALAGLTLLAYIKDFKNKRLNFVIFLFLLVAATLREMGIQHWLTTTDTTAFKIRFFTNPNNPIHEKLIAGTILLTIASIVLYLIWKYTIPIWKGFWNKKPIEWTICSLCALGIASKIADRIPGNYRKSTGKELNETLALILKIIEECGEVILPILVIIALLQHHLLEKKNK